MTKPGRQEMLRRLLRPLVLPIRYWKERVASGRSYAADQEDVAAETLLGGVRRFIDVGANDGISSSNTLRFAVRGAAGLCFEPDPANFERLAGFYRLQRRVECIQEGLSDRAGEATLKSDGLLSSLRGSEDRNLDALLSSFKNTDAAEVTVKLGTLADWLARRPAFVGSDLLSIDVEGHELAVLMGIDWGRTPKPARAMILETHADGASGSWRHKDLGAITELLEANRYREVVRTANNTIWLHGDDWVATRVEASRMRLPGLDWAKP